MVNGEGNIVLRTHQPDQVPHIVVILETMYLLSNQLLVLLLIIYTIQQFVQYRSGILLLNLKWWQVIRRIRSIQIVTKLDS